MVQVASRALGNSVGSHSGVHVIAAPQIPEPTLSWVLVKGLNLSYHNKETIFFTTDPYYGNFN